MSHGGYISWYEGFSWFGNVRRFKLTHVILAVDFSLRYTLFKEDNQSILAANLISQQVTRCICSVEFVKLHG